MLIVLLKHIFGRNHKRYQSSPIDTTCAGHKALQVKSQDGTIVKKILQYYNYILLQYYIYHYIMLHKIFPDSVTDDVAGPHNDISLIVSNTEPEAGLTVTQ